MAAKSGSSGIDVEHRKGEFGVGRLGCVLVLSSNRLQCLEVSDVSGAGVSRNSLWVFAVGQKNH